ncbi:DNA (cytosine-5-)-methyltransferase [Vibrio fluvialis]
MKTFCEFFAGVGLVREGLSKFGWHCSWANDISSDKKDTYCANFGQEDFWLGDVWNALSDESSLPNQSFLYTASFPCTDLSVAGNRAGLAGDESGTLNAVFEVLIEKKRQDCLPKVVLLENVKGFLTSHNGLDVIQTVKCFSELGYYVDIIELDAIDFTPQSRPRVFCVAVLASLANKVMSIKANNSEEWWSLFNKAPELRSNKLRAIIEKSNNLNWGLFNLSAPAPTQQRLRDVVEDIPLTSKRWWDAERKEHLYNQMSDNHKAALNSMIKSLENQYGTVYRRMRKGKSMAELRTDGFAGCLRTPRGGSSKQIIIQAGQGDWSVRLLTPREYARLQGVRDSFVLPENDNKGYFAMGDAVCVPVIEYIAENILEKVYGEAIKATSQLEDAA